VGDEPYGAALGTLGELLAVPLLGQAPQDDRAGEHLDVGVDAEPHQGDRASNEPGDDAGDPFDAVPRDGEPGQYDAAAHQPLSVDGG